MPFSGPPRTPAIHAIQWYAPHEGHATENCSAKDQIVLAFPRLGVSHIVSKDGVLQETS